MNFQEHITKLQQDMRQAYLQFCRFERQWNELDQAFKAKIKEENRMRERGGRPLHTALGVAQQKSDMLALSDAMEAARWWRDKAQAISSIIIAEQAARSMLKSM